MKKIINSLYIIYSFLFIFTMINKEFLLFGLDLRFILLPLGLVLLFFSVIKKDKKLDYYDKNGKLIIIFYIYVFISNISWLWNGLEINKVKFVNEMILLINIFISILVFYRYKEKVKQDQLNIFIVISAIVLIISMILVSCGFELKDISGSADVPYMYVQSEKAPDHKNLFGGGFRPAGYASDPNYATLLLTIACVATLKLKTKKIYKLPLMIIFLTGISLSCSKTILIAGAFALVVTLLYKYTKPSKKLVKTFNILFIIGVIIANIFVVKISTIKQYMPSTLTTRFKMWESATTLFEKSPVIGNGITSFRSYFAQKNWYVQCHSTYWQILSELGIIGILIYANLLYNLLNKNRNNKLNYFILLVYIIYAITCETIALQFVVYLLYIMQLEIKQKRCGNKALFMINTLSNGGAERVCINMANELLKQNYKVDFILLGKNDKNSVSYEIDNRINIYNLQINETNKIKKVLKIINSIRKVDEIVLDNEEDEKYKLITSHLPMSNVLTRLSIIRNRSLYVFHTKASSYDNLGSKLLFKILMAFMYKNRKVVSVSEGVRQESIHKYGLKESDIKTIYNPINEKEIIKKKEEDIEDIGKYLLQVGRFNKAKRNDRMIDVFYKGEFYKNYKLVFCGTGELEQDIKEKVKKLGIKDRVLFLGWQSNVYKWMKNSEVLISTSDYEAFPMNLVEGIICCTKIVSSNCEYGPNEILQGEYAKFLVEPDNIEQYIEKINLALIEYPTTKNPIVEKCRADNIIKEYIKFME